MKKIKKLTVPVLVMLGLAIAVPTLNIISACADVAETTTDTTTETETGETTEGAEETEGAEAEEGAETEEGAEATEGAETEEENNAAAGEEEETPETPSAPTPTTSATSTEATDSDTQFIQTMMLYSILFNMDSQSATSASQSLSTKQQASTTALMAYYQKLNAKQPISQQLNPNRQYDWLSSWMLNPTTTKQKALLKKNHLSANELQHKFGKTYWINVDYKSVSVTKTLYQKIKVGDHLKLIDNTHLQINGHIYQTKNSF